MRPSGPRLATAFFALAAPFLLGACQTDVLSTSGLHPSSDPVIAQNADRGDKYARMAADQAPHILATYGGAYHDEKLERMLAKVVGRLTTVPENPDHVYRITILNSPNVNAFALPGGYVFITRGLLALANDSAEVAAVIAHEMGHVIANHGIIREQKEAQAEISDRVVSEVLHNNEAGREAMIRTKLQLAQFSRNQELQADAIGIKIIGEAGYDPFAAARFLQSLAAYTDFRSGTQGNNVSLDFLATHPSTPQRVQLALQDARQISAPSVGATDRDSFLDGIDGMVFGDAPAQGYVRGNMFLHPLLGIAFSVPVGFQIDNSKEAVLATGPGDVAVRFDSAQVRRGQSLTNYIMSGWVSGLDRNSVQATTLKGMPAATARAHSDKWDFDITVVEVDGQVYRFLTAAPTGSPALATTANAVTGSFRQLGDAEKAALKPLRIHVVTVEPGKGIAELANEMQGTDRKLELFRLLNELPEGASISVGQKVKIVSQ
jgi:predicted Zn-dependent protease